MLNETQRFSLRKLSVGLASVCIGLSFVNMTNKEVKADTVSAQTSVAETKTNKNNKADTNADASKEVANTTNSVDSNKITPSQTVLNKQSTSNDLLKGKDVKQEQPVETKQETPIKQAPVNEQPAVSNKDANINLNKNTIKQALANSLLKDTTKPETTTLNVAKISQTHVNTKTIVEDKTQVTQNQDWVDPAKQGYHKTTAGWTKLKQDKDYNSVANTDISIYSSPVGYTDMHPLPKEQNKPLSYLQMDLGVEFKSTIKKEDISKGKKILLGSIPVLRNDDTRHIDWGTISNNDLINVGDTQIGTLSVTDNNDEWTYVLNVTTNDKFRTDLDLTYKKRIAQHLDYWNFGGYYGMRGQNSLKPFTQKIMDTSGNTYTLHINPADYNTQWDTSSENDDYNSVLLDTNYHLMYLSNKFQDEALDWKDATAQRVFKLQSLNKDNPITIHPTDRVVDTNYVNAINLDNKKLHESIRTDVGASVLHKLTDNLSAQQLLNATADHTIGYSNQKDGGVLIAYKVHASDFKLTSDRIKDAVQNTYWWNIVNPSNKQEILNHTLDMYKKHDNAVNNLMINVYLDWDNSKTVAGVITDVTPNKAHLIASSQHTKVPDGMQSFNTSIYKSINVHFVDDDNNGKTINSDVFTTSTGTDLTYNIKDANDKTFNSATDMAFPTNFVLNQPTTVHYGVVKDINPDIVIHVKHKIVKGVSGDDKMLDNYPNIKKALNASIKLVTNYTYPDNGKFTDEKAYPKQKVFSLTLKRSADVDLTTDSIVSGTADAWSAVNQNGIAFNNGLVSSGSNFGETLPEGYTLQNGSDTTTNAFDTDAFQTSARNAFASLRNAGGLVTKVFNYVIKADPQKIQVKFVDDDDPNKAQVGDIITVNGVTDGQADFKDTIAAYNQDQAKYYVLAKDQTDPNTLKHTFIANDSTMLTVHLKHNHQDVTMSDPKAETTAEYRVIECMPGQYGGSKTIIDLIEHYHKQATKDLVTGVTTYGKYVMSKRSFEAKVGKASDDYFFQIPLDQIVGYTTSSINAPSNEKDAYNYPVLNCFTYTANGVPTITLDIGTSGHDADSNNVFDAVPASHDYYIDYTPNTQTSSYKFVDDDANDKQVGNSVTITGKTDQTVNLSYTAPKNYVLVSNQPTTYSFKNIKQANNTYKTNTVPITIHLKHNHQDVTMSDPNAETTREYRVIERRPVQYGGNKIGVDLVVHAHKTADKDLVTGNITYGNYLGKTTTFEAKAGHPKYADQLSYFNSTRPDKINGYLTVIQNDWSSPERDTLAPKQSTVFNHILYFYQNNDGTYALDFMDGDPHGDSSNRAFAALPASRDFYVDYVAEPQSIQVKFIDQDNAKKQVGDVINLTGGTDSNADFTSVVNTYKQYNAKHYLFVNTDPNQLSHKFTAGDKTIITINLKHQHAKSTAQAPATRTIVVHMPDGSTKTYVQTIGFVNNLDKDLVTNKTTNVYTVDASKSNTTVNGTVDSSIEAYRKTGNDDANGTNYKFASLVLPKVPGYTAHIKQSSINPNMMLFSVSFMALPKVSSITSQKVTPEPAKPAPIETQVPVETHDLDTYTLTANDPLTDTLVFNNMASNDLTWQIVNKNLNNNVSYNLTNTIYKLRLPRFSNYELHLVKRGTTRNSISFVYTNKSTQLNYVFNLKIQDNKYYLIIGKIDRATRKIIPIKTYNVISYQDLLDNLLNYVK